MHARWYRPYLASANRAVFEARLGLSADEVEKPGAGTEWCDDTEDIGGFARRRFQLGAGRPDDHQDARGHGRGDHKDRIVDAARTYAASALVGRGERGKKSCTINLSRPQGPELIRRLIAQSDMVVENFSNGVLAKFGLDYATLAETRPDLIFVSASGTGREGPQRDALAYGSLLQAYSGRASVVGTPERTRRGNGYPARVDRSDHGARGKLRGAGGHSTSAR